MSALTDDQIKAIVGPDHNASDADNHRHLSFVLEGYRAVIREGNEAICPYSPGSARANSWVQGLALANHDQEDD